jgi:hypothetical protein
LLWVNPIRIGRIASLSTRLLLLQSLGSEDRFSWSEYVLGVGIASHRATMAARAAASEEDLIFKQSQNKNLSQNE